MDLNCCTYNCRFRIIRIGCFYIYRITSCLCINRCFCCPVCFCIKAFLRWILSRIPQRRSFLGCFRFTQSMSVSIIGYFCSNCCYTVVRRIGNNQFTRLYTYRIVIVSGIRGSQVNIITHIFFSLICFCSCISHGSKISFFHKSCYCSCEFRICFSIYLALAVNRNGNCLRQNLITSFYTSAVVACSGDRHLDSGFCYICQISVIAYCVVTIFYKDFTCLLVFDCRIPLLL